MEPLAVDLSSPSLPSFDINLDSLVESIDDHTLARECSLGGLNSLLPSPTILHPPTSEDIPPSFENLENNSEQLLSLLNLQQSLSPQLLTPIESPCSFVGHVDQVSETDLHPQLSLPNIEILENGASNERTEVPKDLAAMVHAALQKGHELECASDFIPIPRIVQPARPRAPSLNLNAIVTPRNMYVSPFAQPLSFPFSAPNSMRRRCYGSATSSRYCHICGRGASGTSAAKCSNSRKGTCRKIICEKCMLIHDPLNANLRDRDEYSWVCTHCRMECPACARCHQYARNNMKRRLRNQAGLHKGIKKRSPRINADQVSKILSHKNRDSAELAMNIDKMNEDDAQDVVSHGIE